MSERDPLYETPFAFWQTDGTIRSGPLLADLCDTIEKCKQTLKTGESGGVKDEFILEMTQKNFFFC
jgi:hypothetical protein